MCLVYLERKSKNWGALRPGLIEVGPDRPPKTGPLPTCVATSKFGSSAWKGVCINRREPPKLGALRHRPLALGAWLPPRNTLLSTCVILTNFVKALLRKSSWKFNFSRTAFQGFPAPRKRGWITPYAARFGFALLHCLFCLIASNEYYIHTFI